MPSTKNKQSKPKWISRRAPGGARYNRVRKMLKTLDLHTVCESALCPNRAECWGGGTATIMIMGDVCTRGCRFCAVKTGNPKGVLDPNEPENVASAVVDLGLDYVVLTSVDRDDLEDGGVGHFAATVRAIKRRHPEILVEVLIPDFSGEESLLSMIAKSGAEVLAHNVEVTRRLTPGVRDRRAGYDTSLDVLRSLKKLSPKTLTKSSVMVGLGESDDEIEETLSDLLAAHVDIVTIGQYLRPSPRHVEVKRFLTPEEFQAWEKRAQKMGFRYVAAGPLVRSSYRAGELFVKGVLAENPQTDSD